MAVLVDANTTVICQGFTGSQGTFHTQQMIEYGTKVVAGVTPGKGGQLFENRIPIFDTVDQAVRETGATVSAVLVATSPAAKRIPEARPQAAPRPITLPMSSRRTCSLSVTP